MVIKYIGDFKELENRNYKRVTWNDGKRAKYVKDITDKELKQYAPYWIRNKDELKTEITILEQEREISIQTNIPVLHLEELYDLFQLGLAVKESQENLIKVEE